MNLSVIINEKVLKIEIDPDAQVSDIMQLVEAHALLPIECQELHIIQDSQKIILVPDQTVSEYGPISEIHVTPSQTWPTQSLSDLDQTHPDSKSYYISKAVQACNKNSIQSLYLIIEQYGHHRAASLNIGDTLDIINSLYDNRWNCLHYSCFSGHLDLAKELLELGANANKCTHDNWTPLQIASHEGHLEVIKLLIKHPLIQINKNSKEIGTALHIAAQKGHYEIAQALLAANANPFLENKDKKIAMEVASTDEIQNLLSASSRVSVQLADRPASFSGVVSHFSDYLLHDQLVYLLLNTEQGFFYHYSSREDYLQELEPAIKMSIVSITSVKTSEGEKKYYFTIDCKSRTLSYYTLYQDATQVWADILLDSVNYFQDVSNNRKYPDHPGPASILSQSKYTVQEEKAEDSESEVSLSAFEFVKEIGKGSFGTVSLVTKKNTGVQYALKCLNKAVLEHAGQLKYAISECRILRQIDYPFIVRLYWAFQTKHKLYMVLENCPNGDLGRLIQHYTTISESQTAFYIAQVILAIEFLHGKNIVYRDLKPANVLLDKNGYTKLTDFGLATENKSHDDPAMTFCGSPAYLAPQILTNQGAWKATDVYSIGAMLYEMLVGEPPFYTDQIGLLYTRIQYQQVGFPGFVSDEAKQIISASMAKNPQQRPTVTQLRSAPFFQGFDWVSLEQKRMEPVIDMEEFMSSRFYSALSGDGSS